MVFDIRIGWKKCLYCMNFPVCTHTEVCVLGEFLSWLAKFLHYEMTGNTKINLLQPKQSYGHMILFKHCLNVEGLYELLHASEVGLQQYTLYPMGVL